MENSAQLKNKKRALRSQRFPAYTLENAIEVVREARKFGKTVTDAQIAGKGSIISGAFLRKKAALGYYGLISGRNSEVYITDLAEGIIYPKPGEDKKLIRESFLTPEIFKKIYSNTEKGMPIPLSTFGNILIRDYGIQPVAKNNFLSIFIKSGIFAELIKYSDDTKSDIILIDFQAHQDSEEKNTEEHSSAVIPVYRYEDILSPEVQTVELILTNGKAKIIVPRDLTIVDIKRLKAQIEILANIFEEDKK